MQVEAVDVSGRPETVPSSLWIVKGQIYTVVEVLKDMNSVEYFKLEEIPLEQAKTLYKGFASSRFKEVSGGDELVENLIKELELV